jgi:hypothetical protein
MNDIDLRAIFSDRIMSKVADSTGINYYALMRWFRGKDAAISELAKDDLRMYLAKNFHQLKKFV